MDRSFVHADVEARLRRALSLPLPGAAAQIAMAPRPRPGWRPDRCPENLTAAAGLLLLYPHAAGESHVVLTVRAKDLARHSGQVSLPGGRVEDGESVEVAALREAHEEIDVDPLTVRIAGTLTPLHIPLSGFLLHPVVGLTGSRPAFSRHDGEVAEILEVPLRLLADPSRIKRQRRESSGVHYDVPVYDIDGHSIWGATAMVLAEFLELV